MEGSTTSRRLSWPVLVTILVAAVVTGAILSVWSYQETRRQRVHETTILSLEESLQKLVNRLEEQERINQQLVDKLSTMGKTGLELETELTDTQKQLTVAEERLTATETELTALRNMDWESRYREAERKNELLTEKLAGMELQQSLAREEMEELQRSNDLLAGKNKALAEDFTLLELERGDLARSYDQLRNKYLAESKRREKLVEDIALEEKLSNERVSQLEKDIGEKERIIAKLRSDIESYESMIAGLQQEFETPSPEQPANNKPVEIIVGKSAEKKQEPDSEYRLMRLQSLNQAMNGRGSAERKQILISVIPTIPNGISGEELAGLITGMNSADILSVIRSMKQYISRPLDNDSLSILFSSMTREDADSASVILASDS